MLMHLEDTKYDKAAKNTKIKQVETGIANLNDMTNMREEEIKAKGLDLLKITVEKILEVYKQLDVFAAQKENKKGKE